MSVQKLLEAERRASDIVAEARKVRAQKMKDARTDAQAQIDKFRQEKQAEFDRNLAARKVNSYF